MLLVTVPESHSPASRIDLLGVVQVNIKGM